MGLLARVILCLEIIQAKNKEASPNYFVLKKQMFRSWLSLLEAKEKIALQLLHLLFGALLLQVSPDLKELMAESE